MSKKLSKYRQSRLTPKQKTATKRKEARQKRRQRQNK